MTPSSSDTPSLLNSAASRSNSAASSIAVIATWLALSTPFSAYNTNEFIANPSLSISGTKGQFSDADTVISGIIYDSEIHEEVDDDIIFELTPLAEFSVNLQIIDVQNPDLTIQIDSDWQVDED